MAERYTTWLLFMSDKDKGFAEPSSTMLLERTDIGFIYTIADGNNMKTASGVVNPNEYADLDEAYKKGRKIFGEDLIDRYTEEYAAAMAIMGIEGLRPESIDFIYAGEYAKDRFKKVVSAAGSHIAVRDDSVPDMPWVVVKTTDRVVIDRFEAGRDAFDAMCERNLAAEDGNDPFYDDTFKQMVYQLYITDWLNENIFTGGAESVKEEIKAFYRNAGPDDTISAWVLEHGFAGTLFVCYKEFLGAEFLDKAYVRELLDDDALYEEYEQIVDEKI